MSRRKVILLTLGGLLALGYLLCLPRDLFPDTAYSTVVTDRSGELLGARIAADAQWRFPPRDTVPQRYAAALVQFEDRHFYHHPGVNPVSLVRALGSNLRAGHVVSGGSTLTMQVIRLSRNRERTLWQKMAEAVLATRLELRCSKREILSLYASHAPFGGNVVGLEAAAWRYFGRPSDELSWSEAATLAVLPNAPSSMHPGKNRDALLEKRNRLLSRLLEHGDISRETYELALDEPLPDEPLPLPSYAARFVDHVPSGTAFRSTLDLPLQRAVEAVTTRWSDDLARCGVNDLAALVIDNATGEMVAYVGNASPERERPGVQVDIAAAPRSTGSILKPFLYCAAMQDGVILPRMLLKDTPVNINGFSPQNFDQQFSGAVPAAEALARSLNVPSVHLLRAYGVPRFHGLLRACGLSTLTRDASHYGLSLILGGGEGTLSDITRAYSRMVRSFYGKEDGFPLEDPLALWYTFDALKEVNRPDQLDAHLIPSLRRAAWKTGTSFGFRDAWAVGMTPEYTIGVWAGNAEGQGVPGLTGARTAGPVLFDILNLLPASSAWFTEPAGGIVADVCTESGHLRGPDCPAWDTFRLSAAALETEPCPYHPGGVFVLPPAMEWYYRPRHPEYSGATKAKDAPQMEFIYPENGSTLYLPRQLDGNREGAVFQIAHRSPDATVWWHLDQHYLGETRFLHQMRLAPEAGKHILTAVDPDGHSVSVAFTVAE